jgi:hypothetical protein
MPHDTHALIARLTVQVRAILGSCKKLYISSYVNDRLSMIADQLPAQVGPTIPHSLGQRACQLRLRRTKA